jgi:hypothetical protein
MSIYGVSFVFMSLMKSLPMVARTEVLWRNTPRDWSVKDQTLCTENLHLGHEDDIVKIMHMEGAKCIITWGPTGAKGQPNWAGMGLGRSAQAGWPGPLSGSSRCRHSQRREPFAPGGHPQAREREEVDLRRRIAQLEGSTHKWRRRHLRKCHHDQWCYVWHLDGVIFSFVHGL